MNSTTTVPTPSAGAEPGAPPDLAPRRATARFMLAHPARWLALGFGSGLSPRAPGTVGTLWAWVCFLVLDRWLGAAGWAMVLSAGLLLGWWACTRCAQHLRVADPGAIVWDEVIGFWLVLWLVMPAGLLAQAIAFGLFRFFDAVKPGPVGWADRCFKPRPGRPICWREGWGILFDDLVAAGCTLLVIALWRALV
jgi:phosphatidylglycerophosphatase A